MATEPTMTLEPGYRPRPVHADDDRFVDLATRLGVEFAKHAAQHDEENSFVHENFQLLRESGYVRLAVPTELGGLGASLRQVCYAQAELARYCGATALAVNMHLYLTLANTYGWRHGRTAAEGVLRRVANEGIILMTSGGSDGIWPSATAVRESGGYRITGRKMFCSQAPIANVLVTAARYDDPQEGPIVLMVGIPTNAEGFQVVETWNTMGMRATASHDVQLDDVFVTDAQVTARRPWGKVDPVLRTALVHFGPTVASVYFGVATMARDEAIRVIARRRNGAGDPLANDPTIQRQIGLMDSKLRTAWWALIGALDDLGEDYAPDEQSADTVAIAERTVMTQSVEVVDLALEAVGGSSYFKRSPLERAYRDVRAGKYHPMSAEKGLLYTGRRALGLPVDTIW